MGFFQKLTRFFVDTPNNGTEKETENKTKEETKKEIRGLLNERGRS